MSDRAPHDLRATYTRFRILVIGRANAGKTTLLQRVCNTTEDPCIYDDKKNLLEPTSARGIHDINRPFVFQSNPGFIFHDSPGFETGDENQLKKVLSFLKKRAKSNEVDDQLHAVWFCFVLNNARPLLPLETAFFETARAGRVPVIAIFTKFDDLMTQIYDIDQDDDVNRQNAEEQVEKKFRKPLYEYAFPPRADVCFEDLHSETGNHQDQVKVLIEKTASSLDDTSLKMLFVSVQQNNIGLCVRYAINYVINDHISHFTTEDLTTQTLPWFAHSFLSGYNYGKKEAFASIMMSDVSSKYSYIAFYKNMTDLAVILNTHFKANDSQPGPLSKSLTKLPLLVFAALLICMDNTFWDISRLGDGKLEFGDLFQNSFALYVESGMMKMVETDIDILGDEQGEFLMTEDFKAKFYKFVVDHYLSIPGESQARASGESASGESEAIEEHGQALDLEQKSKKKFTWLRNLMPKFRRRQRA